MGQQNKSLSKHLLALTHHVNLEKDKRKLRVKAKISYFIQNQLQKNIKM